MAVTISITALTAYYANLLAYEYRSAPNAYAQINLWAKQAVFDAFAFPVQDAFNVDTAVGPQLDIIGKYVGVNRNIGAPVFVPYFGFYDTNASTQNVNGFADSTNAGTNAAAVFYQSYYYGNMNTALSDPAYRLVIKLQIILDQNDGTLYSIQNYLHTYLPGLVTLVDNADMTMTYTMNQQTPVDTSVLQQFLPRGMGVGINFIFFTASASPNPANTTRTGTGATNVIAPAISITTTNGVGPYSYAWSRLSGPSTITYVPWQQGPAFTAFLSSDTQVTGTFQCAVSDSLGHTAFTAIVSTTLKNQTPP